MLKYLILILLISNISSQTISCDYFYDSLTNYACELTINNPNGFDNFTDIGGVHLPNRSDADVITVTKIVTNSISTNIPSIICEKFLNIENLHLEFLGVRGIGDSLRSCENLRLLNLFNNELSEISGNSFSENSNLHHLVLGENKIETIASDAFVNLSNLRELSMAQNLLENLPNGVFDSLVNLEVLQLAQNRLISLPDGVFNELRNLSTLHLNNNQLATLRSNLFKNTINLIVISIDSNEIEDLPPKIFASLINIRTLAVNSNKLKALHSDSFGMNEHFTFLFFLDNKIDSFDERIIDHTNLTVLASNGNPCVENDGNLYIIDSTPDRRFIRLKLQQCINNYRERDICEVGNIDNRVCKLESDVEELRELVRDLINENRELRARLMSL